MQKDNREESTVSRLTSSWGKIAGVFSALAVVATALVNVFEWEYRLVFAILGGAGVILLVVGLMLDRNTRRQIEHDKLQDKEMDEIKESLEEIKDSLLHVRKDSVRIQFNQMLWHDRDNIETGLKLAYTYFVELKGDWYMTSKFLEWAKEKGVEVPPQIQHCINEAHKEK